MMELQCPPSSRQAAARPRSAPAPPPSSHHHPASPSTCPALHRSGLSFATERKSDVLQLSLPSCPTSPFLLHKITEAEEREGKDRGGAPNLPTQLFYLTTT